MQFKFYEDENAKKNVMKSISGRICHHRVRVLNYIRKIHNVGVYVELGVHNGTSMSYALQHHSPIECFGIDLFENCPPMYNCDNLTIERSRQNISRANIHNHQFDLIMGETSKSVEELEKRLHGRKIDMLFIDADHEYSAVKKDFELYTPLVKNGGIVVMDDTKPEHPGTFKFMSEIPNNYRKVINFENGTLVLIKE